GQAGAFSHRGAAAHGHGCDQPRVGTDEHVVLDHRAMFVRAVVVACDGTGADIDVAAHRCVAEIGEVIGLAAGSHFRVLDFDEIADMYVFGQHGTRPYAGVGPDAATCPDGRVLDMRKGSDVCAGAHMDVAQHAMRIDS